MPFTRIAVLLTIGLSACRDSSAELHGTGLARQLLTRSEYQWQTHQTAAAHLHFQPNSYAAKSTAHLTSAVDSARAEVLAFLNEKDVGPASELFFVDSREQMQQLIGRPIAGMVQSGEKTAIFVYNEQYKPFLAHELTHLYSHYNWGRPGHGRWLSEGLAMLVTGPCQGHTVNELAAGLKHGNELLKWTDLQDRFEEVPEVVANIQAASMADMIMQRGGKPALQSAWRADSSFASLEKEWLAALDTTSQAHLDVEKLKREGC